MLVNNAAYELAGALEETSMDEAKTQFETNFFGVIRMVKAVLPSMRQQKQGQIINVSSLSGVSAIPFMGIYSASKFALEGYTEALRLEVNPFNIHVSLTEAGFFKTPICNSSQTVAPGPANKSGFEPTIRTNMRGCKPTLRLLHAFDTAGEVSASYAAGAFAMSRVNGVMRVFARVVSRNHSPSRSTFRPTAVRRCPRRTRGRPM